MGQVPGPWEGVEGDFEEGWMRELALSVLKSWVDGSWGLQGEGRTPLAVPWSPERGAARLQP